MVAFRKCYGLFHAMVALPKCYDLFHEMMVYPSVDVLLFKRRWLFPTVVSLLQATVTFPKQCWLFSRDDGVDRLSI